MDAFGGADGLHAIRDGDLVSQRIPPEDVTKGQEFFDGSNPEDRLATSTILLALDGTEVLVAKARAAR